MSFEQIIIAILCPLFLVLYQLIWIKDIKDFVVNKKWYFVINLFCIIGFLAWVLYLEQVKISYIALFLVFQGLINLSVIDCYYLEISGKSYKYILVPAIIYMITNGLYSPFYGLISLAVVFLLFLIVDKIVGIEKMGGADIKLMLILTPMLPYTEMLIMLFLSFLLDFLLYLIIAVKRKISKEKTDKPIAVPMIVAITIATILLNMLCNFILYNYII